MSLEAFSQKRQVPHYFSPTVLQLWKGADSVAVLDSRCLVSASWSFLSFSSRHPDPRTTGIQKKVAFYGVSRETKDENDGSKACAAIRGKAFSPPRK